MTERFNLGYFPPLLIFAAMIGLVIGFYYVFKASVVLCFWLTYVLTRRLRCILSDLLLLRSRARNDIDKRSLSHGHPGPSPVPDDRGAADSSA
jgi:uncharacterized membrane-anchored protein